MQCNSLESSIGNHLTIDLFLVAIVFANEENHDIADAGCPSLAVEVSIKAVERGFQSAKDTVCIFI